MATALLASVFAIATLAVPSPATAQTSPTTLGPPIERWTLSNGLEVALARTDRVPAIAVQVWYRVGSKDEPADKRGTAHMFEHLMFKGSARVAPDAHTRYLQMAGGYSNAITTEDGTAFHNLVPASRLEFALELEADRMRSLVFQPKTVKAQRAIIKREIERNLRNPLYRAVVSFLPKVFSGHPYSWTSGGVAGELEKIDAKGLAEFYTRFYAPSNALIVVAGDVDRATVTTLVEKHFGKLEKGPELPRPRLPKPWTAPQSAKGEGQGKLGFAMAGYRIPAARDADIYPLQLLSLILSRGEQSRLFRKLVASKLAVEAGGQAIVREQLGVFMVFGAFTNPANLAKVETALLAEMDRVAKSGVSAAELKTAVEQAKAALGFAIAPLDGLAQQIGTAWVLTGDPAHFVGDLDRFSAVTTAEIKRVASKYFTPNNRLVFTIPTAGASK